MAYVVQSTLKKQKLLLSDNEFSNISINFLEIYILEEYFAQKIY